MIFNGKSLVIWGLDTCELTQLQALVLVLLVGSSSRMTDMVAKSLLGCANTVSTYLVPIVPDSDQPSEGSPFAQISLPIGGPDPTIGGRT